MSPELEGHKFPLAKMMSLLVRLFGHVIAWVDVGNKSISKWRADYIVCESDTLRDHIIHLLLLVVVL